MTDLAEKNSGLAVETRPFTPEDAPPERRPPMTPPSTSPWPRNAKVVVAILAVIAVLGTLGTIIGFTSGDDGSATEQELQATIDSLTTERNDLLSEATDLQADIDVTAAARDELATELATLDATNEAIIAERDDLVGQLAALELTTNEVIDIRDDLVGQLDALEATNATVIAERDDLIDQLATLDTRITTLTTRRDVLVDRVTALEASLTAQTRLATTAIVERNALADLFPIEFEAAIDVDDVVGTYDIDYTQAFCDGFGVCGTVPTIDEITIRETADDRLEMVMAGNPTAGMLMVDGVLYAVFDSAILTPDARVARITVTAFPQGITVADDGTVQVVNLGASMTIQAPATAGSPAGLAFYAAQLTPQA